MVAHKDFILKLYLQTNIGALNEAHRLVKGRRHDHVIANIVETCDGLFVFENRGLIALKIIGLDLAIA